MPSFQNKNNIGALINLTFDSCFAYIIVIYLGLLVVVKSQRCWTNSATQHNQKALHEYVVVQFYPWIKLYFLLFLGVVMYDNEFETKENKI